MHHLIKLALVALAGTAATLVYGFTAMDLGGWIGALAAGALVGTYVGLAFAPIPPAQQARARRVALGAMVVEAIYGSLYALQVQRPGVFEQPPLWLDIGVAVLHGASFSVLAYFVSMFVVHAEANEPALDPTAQLIVAVERLTHALPALPPPQPHYPAPEAVTLPVVDGLALNLPRINADTTHVAAHVAAHVANVSEHVGSVRCKYCGALVTNAERMVHGRNRKRYGTCQRKD